MIVVVVVAFLQPWTDVCVRGSKYSRCAQASADRDNPKLERKLARVRVVTLSLCDGEVEW